MKLIQNAIKVQNITKRFGEVSVFENYSHDFPTGETSCVMGPSGCGKTTLMRLILGLEKPDAGEIILPEGTSFGCVFQEDRLINHFSAEKNLRLVLKERDDAKVRELLSLLGLSSSAKKPVRELSGGMARRVSLARCLIYGANTILMDEPLKGLDAATRDEAISVIKRLTQGRTLILITHDLTEAQSFGGEIVKLKLS